VTGMESGGSIEFVESIEFIEFVESTQSVGSVGFVEVVETTQFVGFVGFVESIGFVESVEFVESGGVLSFLSGNGPVSVMFLDGPRNDQEDRGTLEGLPAPSDRYCSLRLSVVLGSLRSLPRLVAS